MKYRVKVLNYDGVPDSSGEIFRPQGLQLPYQSLPIYQGPPMVENLIGYADPESKSDGLYADLEFIDLWQRYLYDLLLHTPYVIGLVHDHRGPEILKYSVNAIGLSTGPNVDRRVLSIRDQISWKPVVCCCDIRNLLSTGHDSCCLEKKK